MGKGDKKKRKGQDDDSLTLPSPVGESETVYKLLMPKSENADESFDSKKVKKIEFSQSFKKDKLEKDLPFTHSKLDQLIFKDAVKDSFKLEEAQQFLRDHKYLALEESITASSIVDKQSFDMPVTIDAQRKTITGVSLSSTVEQRLKELKVGLINHSPAQPQRK